MQAPSARVRCVNPYAFTPSSTFNVLSGFGATGAVGLVVSLSGARRVGKVHGGFIHMVFLTHASDTHNSGVCWVFGRGLLHRTELPL